MPNNQSWGKEFDKMFPIFSGAGKLELELKSFISSLLQSERERLLDEVRLEEKPSETDMVTPEEYRLMRILNTPAEVMTNLNNQRQGYNQAIKDLKELKERIKNA